VIPSPRDNLPALPVGPLEVFRDIYVVFSKSHSRTWGHEVLVPIGNAQVVLGIEDIDMLRHLYSVVPVMFSLVAKNDENPASLNMDVKSWIVI
jgi:hypothetical protein